MIRNWFFRFGGCQGNLNNFDTVEKCTEICCDKGYNWKHTFFYLFRNLIPNPKILTLSHGLFPYICTIVVPNLLPYTSFFNFRVIIILCAVISVFREKEVSKKYRETARNLSFSIALQHIFWVTVHSVMTWQLIYWYTVL